MDRKALTSDLTSYDLLKFLALALMIVDHVGHFFYPDELWFRAVGRLSAPIWLFLIGYARSRDFSLPMWIGIVVMTASGLVFGGALLPLCILATMLACRAVIDPLMTHIARSPSSLYPITVFLFFGTLISFMGLEYGTSALMVVMVGYMTRNRETLPFDKNQFLQFVIVVAFGYFIIQSYIFFGFDFTQKIFVGLGLLAVFLGLSCFQPRVYPDISRKIPKPLIWVVQLGGRYSLEIYVAHFVIFKGIAAYLGTAGYEFFNFHIL